MYLYRPLTHPSDGRARWERASAARARGNAERLNVSSVSSWSRPSRPPSQVPTPTGGLVLLAEPATQIGGIALHAYSVFGSFRIMLPKNRGNGICSWPLLAKWCNHTPFLQLKHPLQGFRGILGLSCVIGPFRSLGPAATLRQHCLQMTQRRCTLISVAVCEIGH